LSGTTPPSHYEIKKERSITGRFLFLSMFLSGFTMEWAFTIN